MIARITEPLGKALFYFGSGVSGGALGEYASNTFDLERIIGIVSGTVLGGTLAYFLDKKLFREGNHTNIYSSSQHRR